MNEEPIHIISLGAGVQSSTLALMAAKGEVKPLPVEAVFADTGDEPKEVYEWLEFLKKELPFPVRVVSKGKISADCMVVHKSKKSRKHYIKTIIPAFLLQPNGSKGLLGRRCTHDYKLEMLLRASREIANVKRGEKEVRVINWIGISLDEAHRMKDALKPWMQNRYPLVDMGITRKGCLKWMEQNGFPKPPRSACVFCPFHSDEEWRRLKTELPTEFEKAVKFERDLQLAAEQDEVLTGVPFLTRRCVPLNTIDFSENQPGYQQLDLFGNDCEGLCGV